MEELGVILLIVFGILSLILFFKVWAMCNDVHKITRKILKEDRFKSGPNREEAIFHSEIAAVKELIFCGKTDEAKYTLKRMLYQFVLLKMEWTNYPQRFAMTNTPECTIESNKKAERVIELMESIGETIENKEDYIIPINK